jgi:hypothetical protein
MDGPTVGVAAFVVLFGAALGGVLAHARLPPAVLTRRTRSTIGRGVTMIAVLAALLLALMTLYVVRQFNSARSDVGRMSSQMVELDHVLRQVGAPAMPARELLFRYGARTLKDIWPQTEPRLGVDGADSMQLLNRLEDTVAALHPAEPDHAAAAERAQHLVRALVDANWSLGPDPPPIVSPWLTLVLLFWLMLAFAGWGLLAPRTKLALGSLSLCAAAAAGGLFLMADYSSAFGGMILVSSEPLQNALFVITAGS